MLKKRPLVFKDILMEKKEYLQNYKKFHYSKTRKIVTFPLLLGDYQILFDRANKSSITSNTMAKEVILNFLENKPSTFISLQQKELLQEYMRISRGIATNINQMAHSSNIGEVVDINILISSLKKYEDEFRSLISKLTNDN